jgi:choice-of-anchor B domain-containing protein
MVRALAPSLLVLAVLSSSAAAQPENTFNVSRLSRLDQHVEYNDIWGYTAPDGREYALLGRTDGVSIVNVTDPVAPYETGDFPGPGCTWRDLKTFNQYLYVVNDCAGGVDVIDLTDPENPTYANLFGTQHMSHAHNVAIDTGTGILYAVGTQNGMHVYDLNANPTNPPRIETWTQDYIHDISVKDGMGHAAAIYAGEYRIFDVTNPSNISTLDVEQTYVAFAHSTWANEDNTIVVTADEDLGSRHLTFYDISNPSNMAIAGTYTESNLTVPHNPFIKDEICHVSWYTEGYVALDISDPGNPVKIGRFDSTPNAGPGDSNPFVGFWGCYPFQESGFIYATDRAKGLYVLSLNECSMELPNLAEPQICRVWPDTVSALESPRARVILTGAGFSDATAVTVGGTVMGPGEYLVQDDQTLHFRMPLVAAAGFNDITVTTAAGTSLAAQVEVSLPQGLVLDTGDVEQPVGAAMLVAMGSQPGDLFFPVLGFTTLPSVVPGKVAFDIGNSFDDLIFLDSLPANGAGVNGFPLVVPAEGLGFSVYWQVAVFNASVGLPASVTDYTTTTIVAPE